MRRRQRLSESQSEVAPPVIHAALAALVFRHEPAPLQAVDALVFIKGQCPKCLKTIGRGVAGHLRACNGNLS